MTSVAERHASAARAEALRAHAQALAWLDRPRPAGWTDGATAGVLGGVGAAFGTASEYLQGERRLAALRETIAAQQAALGAQQSAAAARLEGFTLSQAIQAQLAREEELARSVREADALEAQLRQAAALRAQITAQTAAPAPPAPATPTSSASGSGGLGVFAAVGAVALVMGGAVWASRKR